MNRSARVWLFTATGLLVMVMGAEAQQPEAQQPEARQFHPEAVEAISKVRSPFCPGLMLEVCPTLDAAELRETINDGAREGMDADALIEMVVAAHGEEYRAFPKASGTGLLAWVMPPAALLLGLGVVVLVLRHLRAAPGPAGPAPELTDEDRDRLAAALAEMEAQEENE